uniref:REPAT19 n=1 Tax=Spodoptera exigua TaxID=7107 RepID=I0B5T9_SPOEX|nr:REPAT19 [Spodoptera exigua]
MRSFIIIVVLSILAACYDASVLSRQEDPTAEYVTSTMYENGTIVYGEDFAFADLRSGLLSEWNCEAPSIFGQSQTISLQYIGDGSERITRRVTSIYGDPQIAQTPLGGNIYEMTLTSRPGVRISARIYIYGS